MRGKISFKVIPVLFVCLFVMAAWLLIEVWAVQPPSQKGGENQIEKIETDLMRERELLLKFDEKEKKLLSQISDLETEVAEKRRLARELEEKVTVSRNELRVLQERLGYLERSLSEVENRLAQRLDAFYRHAKKGYTRLMATAEGFDQLRRRLKYLHAMMKEDQRSFDEFHDRQMKFRREIHSVKDKLISAANLERAEENRLLTVKEELERKVVLLVKTHKEKEFYETAVKELEAAAESLKETVLGLERREEKRDPLPIGFGGSKGRLPLPVKGRVIKSSGSGRARGQSQKGIIVEGPPQSEVKAVFPGRVDFSGSLRGYGQVVIVNHGSRFFTISAQLSRRDKQEGDAVQEGDVIGFLGQAGREGRARLYFEIRKGGDCVNTAEWVQTN